MGAFVDRARGVGAVCGVGLSVLLPTGCASVGVAGAATTAHGAIEVAVVEPMTGDHLVVALPDDMTVDRFVEAVARH